MNLEKIIQMIEDLDNKILHHELVMFIHEIRSKINKIPIDKNTILRYNNKEIIISDDFDWDYTGLLTSDFCSAFNDDIINYNIISHTKG